MPPIFVLGVDSVDIPQITVRGKVYKMPKKPKMIVWRRLLEFEEGQRNGEIAGQQALDEMYEIVAVAFNSEEITSEIVEANIDLEDLIDTFSYIGDSTKKLVAKKTSQFPNV